MGLERLGFYNDNGLCSEPDYGQHYEPEAAGLRTALRIEQQSSATCQTAGQHWAGGPCHTQDQLLRLSHSALGFRTNGRTTLIHTNGHRGPVPLESTAGFMNSTLRQQSGGRTRTAGVHYTVLDRTTRTAASASTS